MLGTKLTPNERRQLREYWKELEIVRERSALRDFQYVVVRPQKQKICFGSAIERECIPTQGKAMSPFMRRFIQPIRPYPGPCDYPVKFLKKFPASHGYGAIAMKASRSPIIFKSLVPPLGTYDLEKPKVFKQSIVPFGFKNKETEEAFVTPGPGNYKFFKRKPNVASEAFGTKRILIPAVRIICSRENMSICIVCHQQPLGDYWRNFETDEDMCRSCMKTEKQLVQGKCKQPITNQSKKRLKELQRFVRARHCGFYHEHNGTTAAIRLLTRQQLLKKIRGENYLAMFHM